MPDFQIQEVLANEYCGVRFSVGGWGGMYEGVLGRSCYEARCEARETVVISSIVSHHVHHQTNNLNRERLLLQPITERLLFIIIKRRSGINPIPPTVIDRD